MALVDTLCLKILYLRFESSNGSDPISLVMSPTLTEDLVVQPMNVRRTKLEGEGLDKVIYVLYDVGLRVDYVGNEGAGDSRDFMNVVTEVREERREANIWEGERSNPWRLTSNRSPEAMLAGVLLRPAALPITGIGSILDGIIGF